MIVKVCGLKDEFNIKEVIQLRPDAIGLIFHPESQRCVNTLFSKETLDAMQMIPYRVGVFVHQSIEQIPKILASYQLNTAQLHGPYTPEDCENLKNRELKVIKAIMIDKEIHSSDYEAYTGCVDYLLFDTKGPQAGGNGIVYERDLLKKYQSKTPFLISGGIDLDEAMALRNFQHPAFKGIDINSKFEIEPGLKNIELLKKLLAV
ncbi:MAG: phosphoribosylanthranilate isomerase [Flavobacteriales bacterium]